MLDTSIILTLATPGHFEVLLSNANYDWFITPLVRGELTRRETRDPVDRALVDGRMRLTELDMTAPAEVALWTDWSRRVDVGEAEAIAVALSRGWLLALEDRKAQRALDRYAGPGHWLNSVNLLLDAINDGRLSPLDADRIFQALDCYPGYHKRGISSIVNLKR